MNRFRLNPQLLVVGLAACALAAAGCTKDSRTTPSSPSPGGSLSPVSTFAPRISSSPAIPSKFSVQSVPSGLVVKLNGATIGTTPLTTQPAFGNTDNTITIVPSNGNAPFNVVFDQTANGDRTILYNQLADTSGSLGTVSPTSASRNALSRVDIADAPRFLPSTWFGKPQFSTTRMAVRYRDVALASANRRALDVERYEGVQRAVDVGYSTGGESTRIVDVPDGDSVDSLSAKLQSHAEVVWTRPLQLRYKLSSTPFNPNDTHFLLPDQWDMFRIGMPNAWGYNGTNSGVGVAIAMIDTGADFKHADLSGSKITWAESVLRGTITRTAAAAQDTDGHGTNTAGIAAAITNNAFGFAGTGFNANLQIYKIFPNSANPAADTGDEAQAIYDAVSHGARVINLSIGGSQGSGFDPVERDAVAFAIRSNVVVVAAAGNERTLTLSSNVDFPAAYDGVIAVGATSLNDNNTGVYSTATDVVASYSNVGPQLSLVAPGGDPNTTTDVGSNPDILHWIENIYTTTPFDPAQACKNINDCRALFAGTSQASPHVAGAAAMLLANTSSLTPAQVLQILQSTADDIGDVRQGHGRLNVYRAMAALRGDATGTPLPGKLNFVAFAYTGSVSGKTNIPNILDVTYPRGVAVASDGTFRIADIPAGAANYRIAVWADLNGNGIVDTGDYFGATAGVCSANATCPGAAGLVAHPVTATFTLP
ncbi:MAG: S8 family serine peptidase [Candidatus Eremiobacteraeota bacterium]|nr:S8 family serine peptidase [Candidatus Eremiobacteraeota bacterium]